MEVNQHLWNTVYVVGLVLEVLGLERKIKKGELPNIANVLQEILTMSQKFYALAFRTEHFHDGLGKLHFFLKF